jgi:hypothetical protein
VSALAVELEQKMQKAGELRLAAANFTLFEEEQDEEKPEELAGEELAGPYCGCDTCIVREVLSAAWPHMLELARQETKS